jgi:acetyl CoA:N6-hydroxylysine acetyl transferase
MLTKTRVGPADTFTLSFPGDLTVTRQGDQITVGRGGGLATQLLRVQLTGDALLRLVACNPHADPMDQRRALLAALAAGFAADPNCNALRIDPAAWPHEATDALRADGVLDGERCLREHWAQQGELWRVAAAPRVPQATSSAQAGRVRTRRRAMPTDGIVYARDVPALGRRLTLRGASLLADGARVARWLDTPRIALRWDGRRTRETGRAYLARQLEDPRVAPLIAAFDDEPFGYVEAYRVDAVDGGAPLAGAHAHDRGLRALVGESHWRGAPYVAAWLPSLMHYLFLDDTRTGAVYCAPRADHGRMIDYLARYHFTLSQAPSGRHWPMRAERDTFFSGRHV